MVQLGDRVRDRLTGFTGIVVGITDWLYQCRRPIVQPSGLDKDGNVMKSESFDEDQLEVLEEGAFQTKQETLVQEPARTGGPRETPSQRR